MTQATTSSENLNTNKTNPYIEELIQQRKNYEWFNDSDDSKLSKTHPNATPAERLRFLISRDGNPSLASKTLGEYLQWRNEMGLSETGDDSIIAKKDKIIAANPEKNEEDIVWYFATSLAFAKLGGERQMLPRSIFVMDGVRTLDGYRVRN